MFRKLIHIRPRNQVTLPQELTSLWQVGPGDYLQLHISDDQKVTIAPFRVAIEGSTEATEQNRQAESDIQAHRYRTFDDLASFTQSLEKPAEEPIEVTVEPLHGQTNPLGTDPLAGLDPATRTMLENVERALILTTLQATRGNKQAAAARLAERLKKFSYQQDFEGVK